MSSETTLLQTEDKGKSAIFFYCFEEVYNWNAQFFISTTAL